MTKSMGPGKKGLGLLGRIRLRSRRGFTLIELMIATVVMSVGLFAIIHLQVVVVRGNSYSREVSEASELADAVCEYLRIQALNWRDTGTGAIPPLTSVPYFNNFFITPPPASGADFATAANLRALEELSIDPAISPVAISTGTAPADALPITSNGLPRTLAPGLEGLRNLYRVHYVAYQSRLMAGGLPSPNLVTVVVFVSWDNKDHGLQEQPWDNWYDPNTFFDRHMVVKRVLLSPKRTW